MTSKIKLRSRVVFAIVEAIYIITYCKSILNIDKRIGKFMSKKSPQKMCWDFLVIRKLWNREIYSLPSADIVPSLAEP